MNRRERGNALRDRIQEACEDAGLRHVIVTTDPLEAPAGYSHGLVVIVPPKLDFTSWTETVETWTLHVAAGPWDNIIAAWDVIEDIIHAMRAASINLASGEPTPMQVSPGEPAMPGYELELEPDPIHDI